MILFLSNLIDSNDIDLFKNDLKNKINEKSLSSFEAKILIA